MPTQIETLPDPYRFAAGLNDKQVSDAASTTDAAAVISRMLLACLRLDSEKMCAGWADTPDAFLDLFEKAPIAIEKAKAIVHLLEASYARLILTGEQVHKQLLINEEAASCNPDQTH